MNENDGLERFGKELGFGKVIVKGKTYYLNPALTARYDRKDLAFWSRVIGEAKVKQAMDDFNAYNSLDEFKLAQHFDSAIQPVPSQTQGKERE